MLLRWAAPFLPGPPPDPCARGSRPLPLPFSTIPATRSSRPRRPPPARPRSACTWRTGCSPRGAWRAWRSSRRPRTSAASGRWMPRATGSGWSPTGRTPRARSHATGTASRSPTRRSRRVPAVHRRRCAEQPTLLIADEPHHMGEDATWGALDGRGVRARALPAAAVGHAVPLGQLADPVGVLRRRRHLQRRLRLRLHAGAGGRRVPAGDLPHLRRRHGVGERREGPARGLRRHPARAGGRAAAAHRAGPGGRLDHARAAGRARAAAGDPRAASTRTRARWSSRSTRSTRTSSPTGSRGSPASGRTSCTPTRRTRRRGSRASRRARRRGSCRC